MDEPLPGVEVTGGEPAGGAAGRVLVDCGEPARAGAAVGKAAPDLPLPSAPPACEGMGSWADEHAAGAETDGTRHPGATGVPPAGQGPGPVAAAPEVVPETAREDHYRVLGLPPRASREQIERAYRFCRELYGPDSLATYSLLEPQEVEDTRERVDEAYEVLADPGRRRAYDESRGLLGPDADPAWYLPAEPVERGPRPITLPAIVDGAALKRMREARGMSLREIAATSKVGVRFLQYMEEDRVAMLPAPVYLRGFLQEYARIVGLDPRRVADSYLSRIARKG